MIDQAIFELEIVLNDIKPRIWRAVHVPNSVTLRRLHKVIQTAMGWENCHLYRYERAGIVFGHPDPDYLDDTISDQKVALYSLLKQEGDAMTYIYDFGDNWHHQMTLRRILPENPETLYPLCTGGANACPPEDVGGPHGYADYLEALRDPDHEEHEQCLAWRGPFDPKEFDLRKVNRQLQRMKLL
jgi:hypothetical protein